MSTHKLASYNWSALTCPTWDPTVRQVNKDSRHFLPVKQRYTLHYENHTHRPWRLLLNQNVQSVGLRFTRFDVEKDYDRLWIDSGSGQIVYTGQSGVTPPHPNVPPIDGTVSGPFAVLGGGVGPAYLDFTWYTDASVNYNGFKIDGIQINCRPNPSLPSNVREVERNFPHEGYFLGTNDVIWLKVRQPAGYDMGLLLWPLDPGTDFDLFASATETLPSQAGFTWSGTRSGPALEWVKIPAWGSVGGGERWIYIAIGSWSGSGSFRFYANVHAPHNSQRTVGTNWTPSAQNKARIRRLLQKTSLALYMATEGRYTVDSWIVHWNRSNYGTIRFGDNYKNGSKCVDSNGGDNPQTTCWSWWGDYSELHTPDWCFSSAGLPCRPASTCGCAGTTEAKIEQIAADTLLHEFGHCDMAFRLRDENFDSHSCGHSIMGTPAAYQGNSTDFCVHYNGGEDHLGASGHSNAENNWACIGTRLFFGNEPVPPIPAYTPDAFYKVNGNNSPDLGSGVTITEYQH